MSLLEEYRQRAEEAAREAALASSSGVRDRNLHLEATFRAAMQRLERSLSRKAERREAPGRRSPRPE